MKAKNNSPKLDRQLGLFDSTMMVVGIVIGSGIFMTTGLMADALPSASLILIVWLLGGLQMLAGALTYAELGATMPRGVRIITGLSFWMGRIYSLFDRNKRCNCCCGG